MTIEYAATPTVCAHCGERVSTRGRKSRTGKRYHSDPEAYPACVAARQRAAYEERQGRKVKTDQAPTECSNCKDPLRPRAWRSEDAAGRWCQKPNCRADRERTRAKVFSADKAELLARIELLETAIQFLGEVVMADWDGYLHEQRRHCKACGNMDAIDGWVHPDRVGGACMGTLNGMQPRKIGREGLHNAWPGPSRFSDPES